MNTPVTWVDLALAWGAAAALGLMTVAGLEYLFRRQAKARRAAGARRKHNEHS